jgi:CBS domain-containing protein
MFVDKAVYRMEALMNHGTARGTGRQAPERTGTRTIFSGDGTRTEHALSTCALCGRSLGLEEPTAARQSITEVMTRDVLCVRADLSVESLAALFVERGLSGAPVVDDDGRLLGFVSLADLVRDRVDNGETEETGPLRVRARRGVTYDLGAGFHAEELAHNTVGAIMTRVPVTLPEQASIARAAAVMAFEGVRRVPVVDERRRVTGMVASLDVMRWLAQRSGYLVPEYRPCAHAQRPEPPAVH